MAVRVQAARAAARHVVPGRTRHRQAMWHAPLVIRATRHQAARRQEPRLKVSAANVRLGMAVRVQAARAVARHARQVRATRRPLATALALHVMSTPARAHAQRRLQVLVRQAIPALITAQHARPALLGRTRNRRVMWHAQLAIRATRQPAVRLQEPRRKVNATSARLDMAVLAPVARVAARHAVPGRIRHQQAMKRVQLATRATRRLAARLPEPRLRASAAHAQPDTAVLLIMVSIAYYAPLESSALQAHHIVRSVRPGHIQHLRVQRAV